MPVQKGEDFKKEEKLRLKHILAFLLNLIVWPGTGTWLLGNSRLGALQMLAYFIGATLILSGGFGITGGLATILGFLGIGALLGGWAWGMYHLIKEFQKIYS